MIVKVMPSESLTPKEYDKYKQEFGKKDCYLNLLAKYGLSRFSLEDNDVDIIIGNSNTVISDDDSILGERPYIYRHVIYKDDSTSKNGTEIILNFDTSFFDHYPAFIAIAFGDILSEQYSDIMCKDTVNDEFYILRSGLAMYFAVKILDSVDHAKISEIIENDPKLFFIDILSTLMVALENNEATTLEVLIPHVVDVTSGFAAINGKLNIKNGDKKLISVIADIVTFQNNISVFYDKVIYDKNVSIEEYNGYILQIKLMKNIVSLYKSNFIKNKLGG